MSADFWNAVFWKAFKKWQKRSILENSQDGPGRTRQWLHILGFSENPKVLTLEVPDFKFLIDHSRATSNHAYCRCVPKIEENDINQIQLIWALFPSAFFFTYPLFSGLSVLIRRRAIVRPNRLFDVEDFLIFKHYSCVVLYVQLITFTIPNLYYDVIIYDKSF